MPTQPPEPRPEAATISSSDQPRTYCASVAQAQQEPLLGTAPRVDVWLMLEYQPVWEAKALQHNDLPAVTRNWLQQLVEKYAAQGLQARPQFIRQRRARQDGVKLLVARDGTLTSYHASDYAALTEIDPDTSPGQTINEPQYFVCSNGRRDLCCSRFGLPVYAGLRDLVAERAWETSHVGGHRFAANVVVLPQGALYGHLAPEGVAAFVADIEADKLSLPYLRGRSAYPAVAQVAETRLQHVQRLIRCDEQSATFATADGERTIRVTRARQPVRVLPSCGAEEELVYPLMAEEPDPGTAPH